SRARSRRGDLVRTAAPLRQQGRPSAARPAAAGAGARLPELRRPPAAQDRGRASVRSTARPGDAVEHSAPMPSKRRTSAAAALIAHRAELGLRRYPGAHEKSPWPGHRDLAVNDKTFAYLSAPGDPPGLSLKLPFSRSLALDLPGAEPTPYGLGKSGWVSLTF